MKYMDPSLDSTFDLNSVMQLGSSSSPQCTPQQGATLENYLLARYRWILNDPNELVKASQDDDVMDLVGAPMTRDSNKYFLMLA